VRRDHTIEVRAVELDRCAVRCVLTTGSSNTRVAVAIAIDRKCHGSDGGEEDDNYEREKPSAA
jgi:hypothetical protein